MNLGGMVRAGLVLGAVLGVGVIAAAGSTERSSACSLEPITTKLLPEAIDRSAIVVTGRWVDSSEKSATLMVEKGLLGATTGERLRVDNHRVEAWNCEFYGAPDQEGFRFGPDDPREWLVFLEKKAADGWQITWLGMWAWPLTDDPLKPLITPRNDPFGGMTEFTFDDLRRLGKEGTLGTDLGFEGRPPCNWADDPKMLFPMSTAVVRANVVSSQGRVWTLEPIEWFGGGNGDDTFTLNTAVVLSPSRFECKLTQYLGPDNPPRPPQEVVVFMRPDQEFGMADWRVLAWGTSLVEVNERYVTRGRITFADVARLAGHPQLAERESHGGPVAVAVTLVVAALAAGGLVVLARRH